MKTLFLNKTINLIKSNNQSISDLEIEKIRYGLEGIYLSMTKLIIILALAIYLGIWKEFLIFTLFYNGIRMFAFGLHASKSYLCLVFSSLIFIISPIIAINIDINFVIKIILCLLSIIMIIVYAPADTHKRPLIKAKKRLRLKTSAFVVTIIYVNIILLSKNVLLSNIVLLALMAEIALILPITYKIFKMPYNNYKTYVHKLN